MQTNIKDAFKGFLLFNRMITPTIIQVIFAVMLFLAVVVALYSFIGRSFIFGLTTLIVGPLFARITCEMIMVFFRIQSDVAEIKEKMLQK